MSTSAAISSAVTALRFRGDLKTGRVECSEYGFKFGFVDPAKW